MYLTRRFTEQRVRWALDGRALPRAFDLTLLMQIERRRICDLVQALPVGEEVGEVQLLAPIAVDQEV